MNLKFSKLILVIILGFYAINLSAQKIWNGSQNSDWFSNENYCVNQPKNHVKSFAFGHSLYNHIFPPDPSHADYTATGYWLGILAQSSNTFGSNGGMWGQIDNYNNLWTTNPGPPTRNQLNYIFSSNTNNDEFWSWTGGDFVDQEFTDFYFMTANFVQTWQPDPIYFYPEALQLIDSIHASYPDAQIHFYVHWPKTQVAAEGMGTTFGNYADLTESEFSIYNQYTSGDYWEWHKNLFEMLSDARPNYDLKLMPVGQIIADLLETAPYLSSLSFTDLYHDDGPHGLIDKYLLAGMVTYRAVYGQNPDFDAADIPSSIPVLPAISNNLAQLVQDIEARLDYYCGDINSYTSEDLTSRVSIQPNPFLESTTINFDNPNNDNVVIQIFDATGQLVNSDYTTLNNYIIKKAHLKSGLYHFMVSNPLKTKRSSGKFVIK